MGASIESVALARGPCLGMCPVYRVTLRENGRAEWEGEAFTGREGRHNGELDSEEFRLLARFIQRSAFFSLEDDLPPSGTCLPDYTITVRARGRVKRVTTWADSPGPPDFEVIARLVDAIADRIEWEAVG